MRTLKVVSGLFILISLIAGGCKKDFKKSDGQEEKLVNMKDLKVSPAFDWSLVRQVEISLPEDIRGIVKVTSTDKKTEYYKGLHTNATDNVIRLSVPSYLDQLLVNSRLFDLKTGQFNGSTKSVSWSGVTFGAPFTYFSGPSRCPDAVALDNDHFVVTYAAGDYNPSYLLYGTKSGSNLTFGSPFLVPSSSWAYYATATQLEKIDAGKILVCSKGLGYGLVTLMGISGGTFTACGSVHAGRGINYPSICLLDGTYFVYAYADESATNAFAKLCIISGTSLIEGPEVYIPYGGGQFLNVKRIDATRMLFTYRNAVNGSLNGCVGYISGSSIALGPNITIETDNTQYAAVDMLAYSQFVVAYSDYSLARKACARVLTVGGISFSPGPRTILNALPTDEMFMYAVNSTDLIFAFSDDDGTGMKFRFMLPIVSGGSVFPQPPTILYSGFGVSPSVCSIGTNQYIITMRTNSGAYPGYCYLSAPPIIDADGDGVQDSDDAYPHDPLRAFDIYYPAAGYGTLGFEDLWPSKGDYDFNDAVVDYRFHTITNAQNKVVDVYGSFRFMAMGAAFHNGFGFNLPQCSPTLTGSRLVVTGYDLHRNYIHLNGNGNESGQAKPTVIVWDDGYNFFPDFANTQIGVTYYPPVETVIHMTTPGFLFTVNEFAINGFNPFIICDQWRGKEVHLPDYPPTSLADPQFFMQGDDSTVVASGRYYKSAHNYPWAINIPESFAYPTEMSDINWAHLKFAPWAESSGVLFPDWYHNNPGYRNPAYIYTH